MQSRSRLLFRGFSRSLSYVQGQSPTPRTREYFYYIDHQGQLFLDDTRVKNFITCFKDKKFLDFFFRRVKVNTSGRYEGDFPFISPCGRETNYIRCDDLPIVFTHLLDSQGHVIQDVAQYGGSEHLTESEVQSSDESNNRLLSGTSSSTTTQAERDRENGSTDGELERLSYGGTLELLTVPFQPSKLCMLPGSGRIYHEGLERLGGVGLVKSSLAIELSRFFVYEAGADDHSPPSRFVWRGRTWDLDETVLNSLMRLSRSVQ